MTERVDVSWLPTELESVAMRLARVDEAVFAIADVCSLWSLNDPLHLVQRRDGASYDVIVKSVRPIPPLIILLFSEAVNHLRAAIDNTVWHMATTTPRVQLDARSARRVAMPICETKEDFDKWTKGISKMVPTLGQGTSLHERVQSLQPFNDTESNIADNDEFLAAMMGRGSSEQAHPLLLLQGYSNEDKHRAIRTANTHATQSRPDQPFWGQDRDFRMIATDDVLATGQWGEPVPLEISPAVMVRRAAPFTTWVSPARELGLLNRYVRNVAVPVMITGQNRTGAFPSTVDFGDNGQTPRERLLAGELPDARERMRPVSDRRFTEAMRKPMRWAEVVDVNQVEGPDEPSGRT